MSTPFQNRLVGTVIVAAAIIIFLPDILDGEKETYQADFEAIPNAPAFQSTNNNTKKFPEEKLKNIPKQPIVDETALDEEQSDTGKQRLQSNVNSNTVTVVAPLEKSTSSQTANTKPPVESTDKAGSQAVKPQYAWVIHLGSFKHQKNVNQLMKKIKDNGYTAFTQPIKTKKGTLTKVIVGPSLNKAELEKNILKLKELTKVQGKIARFKVTK